MTISSVAEPPAALPSPASFELGGYRVEVAEGYRVRDPAAEVARLTDPGAAVESLYWGRNYLYRACLATLDGPVDVVVKQFREESLRARLRRRSRGSKGRRNWRAALAMREAGLPTPEPVMMVESELAGGPSFYICRHLPDAFEARYLLRAARIGREAEDFPAVDFPAVLSALGRLIARLHTAGIWHRDISVGNVLLRPRGAGGHDLFLIDLNRARFPGRLTLLQRQRDLSRLALTRAEHREIFLAAYWGEHQGRLRHGTLTRSLFRLFQGAFESKGKLKRPLRALGKLSAPLRPRRAHAHIPEAPAGASSRDKIVWDHLSDQPHQHAGRFEKLKVRLADAPSHLESLGVLTAAAPRIYRRFRQLRGELYREPVTFTGVGIALRPYPEAPEELLAAVDELGVRHALLRLHPWQEEHDAEEELARELTDRGIELAFALPQNRELVRDPERWRRSVAHLAERFTPYGKAFQVGQAINRSKWGIWRYQEYVQLARIASKELRRFAGTQVLGPATIDFEHHVTASVLNLRRRDFYFDAVASLLYVDRRGAPERQQMGFGTVDKVVLLRAIAETARNSTGRCWITEVNWPLWEGPHSPAGKSVAVSEEQQADYLVRYYILALATGLVERVYWWQMIARGYGLIAPGESPSHPEWKPGDPVAARALRRRPAFHALARMHRELAGATSHGPIVVPWVPSEARLYRFSHEGGRQVLVGWSIGPEPVSLRLPEPLPGPLAELAGKSLELGPSPRYFSSAE